MTLRQLFCWHRFVEMYDELTFIWNGEVRTWFACKKCGKRRQA